MRTNIANPKYYNTKKLIESIERDRESFTSGRRNNDLVNWFLLKAIDAIETKVALKKWDLIAEFNQLFAKLGSAQQANLNSWEVAPADKIETLFSYYGNITDTDKLSNLWLPMDYEIQ